MIRERVASFGSWKSPITADLIVVKSIRLREVVFDGDDIYYIDKRHSLY